MSIPGFGGSDTGLGGKYYRASGEICFYIYLQMLHFPKNCSGFGLRTVVSSVVVMFMLTNKEKAAESSEDRGFLVKAEGNFEDHPYFTVGNQRNRDGIVQHTNTIRTKDGQELKQTWTVRAVHGLGLPGKLDQDVYVALLQLVDRQGGVPEDGWIGFSLYELVELLQRTHGGRDYKQIKESLERLSGTTIQSRNAFYRKSTMSYIDDSFHLLDRVQHSETMDGAGKRGERTWIQLSSHFVDSYRANYSKMLDADFYWSLNSSVAKRLFRFIDKKRNQRRRWEVDLFSLRDRIPLSPYPYPSKVREKLTPAHEELTHKGFLANVTYRKTGDGSHLVCYEIKDSFASRRPVETSDQSPETRIALERLKSEGLREDIASDLISAHGPERCVRYAEAVAFQKNIRNRPGWLRKAIENAYDLDVPLTNPSPPTETTLFEDSETDDSDQPEPPSFGPMPNEDPTAREPWDAAIEAIDSESMPTAWISQLVPTSLENNHLTVHAPNDFVADYVSTRMHDRLLAGLRQTLNPTATLSIEPPEPVLNLH